MQPIKTACYKSHDVALGCGTRKKGRKPHQPRWQAPPARAAPQPQRREPQPAPATSAPASPPPAAAPELQSRLCSFHTVLSSWAVLRHSPHVWLGCCNSCSRCTVQSISVQAWIRNALQKKARMAQHSSGSTGLHEAGWEVSSWTRRPRDNVMSTTLSTCTGW